jgi:hypothetical protein
LRLSFIVVDVFSEFFAIFLGEHGDQFIYSEIVLQLQLVHFLSCNLSQGSEKLDFDFHQFSIVYFFGVEFILFYALSSHYWMLKEDQVWFWSIKLK